MVDKIIIDPITRVNGNFAVEVTLKDNKVTEARCLNNTYWGLERTLEGKHPLEAVQILQRTNGLNSIAHGIVTAHCLEQLSGSKPPKNSRIIRNLMLAAEYLQTHIMHFYHFALFDYVDVFAVKRYKGNDPALQKMRSWLSSESKTGTLGTGQARSASIFVPSSAGSNYIKDPQLNIELMSGYIKAGAILIKIQKMLALLGGRVPHVLSLVPGGLSFKPQKKQLAEYKKVLLEVERFIKRVYVPQVFIIANEFRDYFKIGLYNNLLSFGVFDFGNNGKKRLLQAGAYMNEKPGPFDGKGNQLAFANEKIEKHLNYARFKTAAKKPGTDMPLVPDPLKRQAYSWSTALRYDGSPMETGPLARLMISYLSDKMGSSAVRKEVDSFIQKLNIDISTLFSVQGRHVARAIECTLLCAQSREWLSTLEIDKKTLAPCQFPEKGTGSGFIEAANGPVGQWISLENGKISNHQCIAPTDWFWSPRDDKNGPGPVELMLLDTPVKDPKYPLELLRIIRSF